MEFTREESELVARYVSGDLTETQFNWWIVQNGWDKEKLDALVKQVKEINIPLLIWISAHLVFGLFLILAVILFQLFRHLGQ